MPAMGAWPTVSLSAAEERGGREDGMAGRRGTWLDGRVDVLLAALDESAGRYGASARRAPLRVARARRSLAISLR